MLRRFERELVLQRASAKKFVTRMFFGVEKPPFERVMPPSLEKITTPEDPKNWYDIQIDAAKMPRRRPLGKN